MPGSRPHHVGTHAQEKSAAHPSPERDWLDQPEILACRRGNRRLLFSTWFGTSPFVTTDDEIVTEAWASRVRHDRRVTPQPPQPERPAGTGTEGREKGSRKPWSHSNEPCDRDHALCGVQGRDGPPLESVCCVCGLHRSGTGACCGPLSAWRLVIYYSDQNGFLFTQSWC